MKQNYSKYSDKDLEKTLSELKLKLMGTYRSTEKVGFSPELRPKIRKEIARIKTEQNKRK